MMERGELREAERARELAPSRDVLDWEAIAMVLVESEPRPVMLLDGGARVRLVNHALESLLGRARSSLLGRTWEEVGLRPREAGGVVPDELIRGALRGLVRRQDFTAFVAGGRRMRLSIEFTRLGAEGGAAVLASVVESAADEMAPCWQSGGGIRQYEVSSRVNDFGALRVLSPDGVSSSVVEGKRCYELMHQRDTPCSGCPLLTGEESGWPRTAVLRSEGDTSFFRLVTAEPAGSTHFRVTVQTLSDAVFRQIIQARVRRIADAAGLSERERAVLDLLVAGTELAEVARRLGITVRTVKFHQSNVQTKLGARSRAELMRLVM